MCTKWTYQLEDYIKIRIGKLTNFVESLKRKLKLMIFLIAYFINWFGTRTNTFKKEDPGPWKNLDSISKFTGLARNSFLTNSKVKNESPKILNQGIFGSKFEAFLFLHFDRFDDFNFKYDNSLSKLQWKKYPNKVSLFPNYKFCFERILHLDKFDGTYFN